MVKDKGLAVPAGRLALCFVATGADRRVPPRGADHWRSDGAGPRDSRRTLDPSLSVPGGKRTLADHVAGSIAERRLRVLPADGFAGLVLAVAMVGLFRCALARAVVERRQALAIHAAVGASPGRLVRLVLRSAIAVTGAGLAAGVSAAAATLAAVAAAVLAALAASAIPGCAGPPGSTR